MFFRCLWCNSQWCNNLKQGTGKSSNSVCHNGHFIQILCFYVICHNGGLMILSSPIGSNTIGGSFLVNISVDLVVVCTVLQIYYVISKGIRRHVCCYVIYRKLFYTTTPKSRTIKPLFKAFKYNLFPCKTTLFKVVFDQSISGLFCAVNSADILIKAHCLPLGFTPGRNKTILYTFIF